MEEICLLCGNPIPEGVETCQECEEAILMEEQRMETKIRVTEEVDCTWRRIEEILAAGKAREMFGDEGQITVQVKGIGEAVLNILDYDKDKTADKNMHTMTLQFADLLFDEMPFDEDNCNKWEKSSIRNYLNSIAFKERFEEGFRKMLVPVIKENDGRQETLDTFFLLSVDEMRGETKKYRRFRTKRDCVKVNADQETDWHWTRTANRDCVATIWLVAASGYVSHIRAVYSYRFAPACVIAAKRKERW